MTHTAKRSLGQNFLTSRNIARDIASISDIAIPHTILEIGPGKGMLTRELISTGNTVVAVEKDDELFHTLTESFKQEIVGGNLDLIHDDILNVDTQALALYKKPYILVANIPYNITGLLLRKFLSSSFQPLTMTLMVQKEVGERILAKDGKESLLSMSVKIYATPSIKKNVPRKHFIPQPNVDSVVLHLSAINKAYFESRNEDYFFEILRIGFAHKRKKLIGNLKELFDKPTLTQAFANTGLDENIRAERLQTQDWVTLYDHLFA